MTADSADFTLILAKEDFKFSCAHFTLFGADDAELLHGHNYQVGVEVQGRALDEEGLLVQFPAIKVQIRRICSELDSFTLIPATSPHLLIETSGTGVQIRYGDRTYLLPEKDVKLLPVVNTSIEVMARMIWKDLAASVDLPRVERLGISVSETAGQTCWYRARPPGSK